MFGNPLASMLNSSSTSQTPSQPTSPSTAAPNPTPETLALINLVLDHIRANLSNIRNTWGADSPQYRSATEIMDKYLTTNMKALNVTKPDLEALMGGLSLDDGEK